MSLFAKIYILKQKKSIFQSALIFLSLEITLGWGGSSSPWWNDTNVDQFATLSGSKVLPGKPVCAYKLEFSLTAKNYTPGLRALGLRFHLLMFPPKASRLAQTAVSVACMGPPLYFPCHDLFKVFILKRWSELLSEVSIQPQCLQSPLDLWLGSTTGVYYRTNAHDHQSQSWPHLGTWTHCTARSDEVLSGLFHLGLCLS